MGNQQSYGLSSNNLPWSKDYSLVDKQPLNNTFILHHMPSNNVYKIKLFVTPKNNTHLKQLITTKMFRPSTFVLKLQNTQTCTKQNYCSTIEEIYLMYPYIESNLKQQILNRKFRKQGFLQGEIKLVIQNISKALMYLANIGQPHRNLSTTEVLISQERGILLNDPWFSENSRLDSYKEVQGQAEQHYHKMQQYYPSPQKILYQNNLIQSYNQFYSSLFSLGIIVLQIIYMESMDILYQKGVRKIYINKVKQKVQGVSHESIRQDLRRLLSHEPRIRQSVCIRYQKHKTDYLFLQKPKQDFKYVFDNFKQTDQSNNHVQTKHRTNGQFHNNYIKQTNKLNTNAILQSPFLPFDNTNNNFNRQNYLLPQQFENKNIHIRQISNQFNKNKKQSLINQLKKLNKSPQQIQYRRINNSNQNYQKIRLGSVIANKHIKKADSIEFNPYYQNGTERTLIYRPYNYNYPQIKNISQNQPTQKNYNASYSKPQTNFKYPLKNEINKIQIKNPYFNQQKQQKYPYLNGKQNGLQNYNVKQAKSLYQDSNHQSFVIGSWMQKNGSDFVNGINQQKNKEINQSERNSFAIGALPTNQIGFDGKNSFQMGSKISHRQKSNSLSFDQLDPILSSKSREQNKNQIIQQNNISSSIKSSGQKVKTSLQTPQRYPLKGRQNSTIKQVSEQYYSHSRRSGSYSNYNERQKSVPLSQIQKQQYESSPNRGSILALTGSHYQKDKQNYPKIKKLPQGKTQLIFEDESSYVGQIKNNKKNGYGVLYYPNKKIAYEGNWLNDDFNGRGRIYNCIPQKIGKNHSFQNLQLIDDQSIWESYDGEFVKDHKHGKGRIKLSNGQIFNGNWANDLPDGEGKYYCNDGSVINGHWIKGIFQN